MSFLVSILVLPKLERGFLEGDHSWSWNVPDMACISQGTSLWMSLSCVLWTLKFSMSGSTDTCPFFSFLSSFFFPHDRGL